MGFEVTRFIGKIPDKFYCSICTMVLEEALVSPCNHIFCKECIEDWLETNETCPVDHSSLNLDELQLPPRFFRYILNKFDIECNFQQDGCQAVVALDHLRKHVDSCTNNPKFHPDAEIVCDKGCNLKVTRRQYQENNCFAHLTHCVRFYKEENRKLCGENNVLSYLLRHEEQTIAITHGQCEQNDRLVKRLQEDNIKFNHERNYLLCRLGLLEEQNKKLSGQTEQCVRAAHLYEEENKKLRHELNNQITEIKKRKGNTTELSDGRQQNVCPTKPMISTQNWRDVVNMKIESNTYEAENKDDFGFVTSTDCLIPLNPRFRVKILSVGDIIIGLQNADNSACISYDNNGSLWFLGIENDGNGPSFEEGDVIECGIRYPQVFNHVRVYFYHNEQLVIDHIVNLPGGGYFPSVYISGFGKIEYLSD